MAKADELLSKLGIAMCAQLIVIAISYHHLLVWQAHLGHFVRDNLRHMLDTFFMKAHYR